jgi:sarcosine oxidase subunit alpha
LFRDLGRVMIANVSSQWAAIVVCGPRSRELIESLGTDIALAREDFPFMAVRAGRVAGVSARVFRVSFTGELSYELNVRPRDAQALWLRVIEAGRALGIEPVGSEANHVLRVEKGFISIGHEADGIANPDDLGLGWAIHLDKGDFVGRRSILRDRAGASARPELVGLEVDEGPPLEEGAQIVAAELSLGSEQTGEASRSLGFVTASVASPALGRSIALALLEDGRARLGQIVQATVAVPGGPERGHAGLRLRRARVVAPVFVDPEGVRLRG